MDCKTGLTQMIAYSTRESYLKTTNKTAQFDVDASLSYRIKICLKIIKKSLQTGSRILDVGCGMGHFGEMLANLGYKVYGVDVLKCRRECLSKGYIDVRDEWNIEKGVPYADEAFDLVFAGEIIEHLWDTSFFLREVNRVLRVNGILLLTTPNMCYLNNIIRILSGRQLYFVDYARDKEHIGAGHITYYSAETLKKHLKDTGFNNVSFFRDSIPCKVITEYTYVSNLRKYVYSILLVLGHALSILLSKHGMHLIVLGRKRE